MTIRKIAIAAAGLAVLAGTADAQPRPRTEQRPELFEALIRCRGVADDAARLQCFDSAAAALEQATERREVVVVDRAQVREGRRRLFGLALPRLPIFGGGEDGDEDEISRVEGVIASVSTDGMGHWTLALEDGAVWVQTDNRPLALRPRVGQPVVIERGALGSFMARVNRQPGIRVRRVR